MSGKLSFVIIVIVVVCPLAKSIENGAIGSAEKEAA